MPPTQPYSSPAQLSPRSTEVPLNLSLFLSFFVPTQLHVPSSRSNSPNSALAQLSYFSNRLFYKRTNLGAPGCEGIGDLNGFGLARAISGIFILFPTHTFSLSTMPFIKSQPFFQVPITHNLLNYAKLRSTHPSLISAVSSPSISQLSPMFKIEGLMEVTPYSGRVLENAYKNKWGSEPHLIL